ncbi:GNAT family N-acetyltransferase [Saccharopolyspora sp. NPDC050389]|uniref:GNAT family N-acetyltransferase n=1 Tax=Saccharopolyspora sp. NPDC050389 TaxID=3155516 RepID=UPI0033F888E0
MPSPIQILPLSWVSAEKALSWHAVMAASLKHDLPDRPPTPKQVHARLTAARPDSRRLLWLAAEPDGSVTGVAGLRLFTPRGQEHLAELELHVRPDRRRRGVGSQLLAQAVFAAQVENRRSVFTGVADAGPGDAFCAARGFLRVLTSLHLSLDLSAADDSAADAARPGYELASWTGTVPDGLADTFAAAKAAVNDMPTGEQRRDAGQVPADRGDILLVVAALHGKAVAGYTEIVIRADENRRAQQRETAVVPEHRGRGLGLWLKAAMVRRLRTDHPGIAEIETDHAEDDVHLCVVNRRLGFRPHRRSHEYRLSVRPAGSAPPDEEGLHDDS